MQIREAKFIEAKIAGKNDTQAAMYATGTSNKKVANVQASRIKKSPVVQTEFDKLLKQQGITLKKALKPIGKGLIAQKTIVHGKDGNDGFVEVVDDIEVQLKSSDRALKLLGITNQVKSENAQSHNMNEQITPELHAAMKSGDEVELQRAVFRKVQND
jgi:hypothetical protein